MKNGTKKKFSKQEVKHSYLALKSAKWHFPKNWLVQTVQDAQTFTLGPFFLVNGESEIKKVALHNIKDKPPLEPQMPWWVRFRVVTFRPHLQYDFYCTVSSFSRESIFMLHVVV